MSRPSTNVEYSDSYIRNWPNHLLNVGLLRCFQFFEVINNAVKWLIHKALSGFPPICIGGTFSDSVKYHIVYRSPLFNVMKHSLATWDPCYRFLSQKSPDGLKRGKKTKSVELKIREALPNLKQLYPRICQQRPDSSYTSIWEKGSFELW